MSGKERAARILAIIVFSITMSLIVAVFITDGALFAQQIITFITACIGAAAAWIFGIIAFVVSIMMIFGILLIEQYGFWPNTFASNAFKDIMKDAVITNDQLIALKLSRTIFLIFAIIAFIGAIVALSMRKSVAKDDHTRRQGLTKTFGVLSLVFSILTAFASLFILLMLK